MNFKNTQICNCDIVAIVVTYHPELNPLKRLLAGLTRQVDLVVIVDNSSTSNGSVYHATGETSRVEVLQLGANRGIATAQNVGIQWARARGAEYVLLMDQDSEPAADMVEHLANALCNLRQTGDRVACVGPLYSDPRHDSPSPFVKLKGIKFRRIPCDSSSSFIPVDFVIASGCLIPMSVLNSVGEMKDNLFIDYVDVEWGLRASRDGYQSFGVCAAKMYHSLGDEPINVFGRIFPAHSPLRGYYRFRNGIILLRQPWVKLTWKLADGRRLFLLFIFFSIFSKSRLRHFRMMSLGVWHGLLGKSGKFTGG